MRSHIRLIALALAVAAWHAPASGTAPDPILSAGFDPQAPASVYVVEFVVHWPFHAETITCGAWSAATGPDSTNTITGNHCDATGSVPNLTGMGAVSASFDLGGPVVTLTDCAVPVVYGSGANPDVVLSYTIDCT